MIGLLLQLAVTIGPIDSLHASPATVSDSAQLAASWTLTQKPDSQRVFLDGGGRARRLDARGSLHPRRKLVGLHVHDHELGPVAALRSCLAPRPARHRLPGPLLHDPAAGQHPLAPGRYQRDRARFAYLLHVLQVAEWRPRARGQQPAAAVRSVSVPLHEPRPMTTRRFRAVRRRELGPIRLVRLDGGTKDQVHGWQARVYLEPPAPPRHHALRFPLLRRSQTRRRRARPQARPRGHYRDHSRPLRAKVRGGDTAVMALRGPVWGLLVSLPVWLGGCWLACRAPAIQHHPLTVPAAQPDDSFPPYTSRV
jgi:hypothetical protein